MQPANVEVSTTTLLAPALLAGAIVVAFFACHYSTERKNRRDFLRWCETILPPPPTPGRGPSTHPAGLHGVGAATHGVAEDADSVGFFIRKHARGYALVILFVGLVSALRLWLEPVLQGRLSYIFFSVAVLLTALVAGIWETLLALILGFLAAEWLIVEPRSSFMISGTHGWLGALLYFALGLGIVWFKRSGTAAERRALASDIAHLDRLKEFDRERTLRAMLAHIVETCQEAVFSLTTGSRIMTWNAAAEKLSGFSGPEAIGQPLALILLPEERSKAERILETIGCGDPVQHWQTTLNRKDGTRVEVSLSAASARDAEGKVIGVSVVARPRSSAS